MSEPSDLEKQESGPVRTDEVPKPERQPPRALDPAPENAVLPSLGTPVEGDHHNDDTQEYDERAAKFWSVYVDEAEHHDKALIETWKDDMEGIIIFAGLYSASLTAFLVESYQNLQANPAQQSVFLMQQTVTLLSQISQQLGPNGSQVPVVLPAPLPEFDPSLSDVRVNVFWFMSLVFSLTAALAATIVQSWVRDYMHVFQRYNHSLKRARIRQFLYEGAEGWYMNVIVDGIPALIHISLFLFFVGLSDFLFNINYTTAVTTTALISVCASLYLWSVIAPIVDAQSPYQSPLSGVFWLMFQIVRGRSHKDYSTAGKRKRVSTNMTEGRVQLAMDQSEGRKKRDARAICWVIDNLTEDSELEPFVQGIPGSLNSPWGKEVWAAVKNTQPPSPAESVVPQKTGELSTDTSTTLTPSPTHQINAVGDLSGRITRLLKTCTDPGILTEDARRKRVRACVDAALSLVLSMDGEWEWFAEGEILSQALIYLGDVEKIREAPAGFDSTFAVRWTCMTLMATRKMLQTSAVKTAAQRVISKLAEASSEKDKDVDESAARTIGIVDKQVKLAWDAADTLAYNFEQATDPDKMEEQFSTIASDQKWAVVQLGTAWNSIGWLVDTDDATVGLTQALLHATGGVLAYLPGAILHWPQDDRRSPATGMAPTPAVLSPQFVPARFLAQRAWLSAYSINQITTSGWAAAIQPNKLTDLSVPDLKVPELKKLMDETVAPFRSQLWRLQDLCDGGLVYTLELLIAAIRSNKLSSHQSSRPVYIGTLKAITSDWVLVRDRPGTQKCLVALLRDIVVNVPQVPDFIIDEVVTLLGNVLKGTKGPHVNEAILLIRQNVDSPVAQEVLRVLAPPKRHHSKSPRVDNDDH